MGGHLSRLCGLRRVVDLRVIEARESKRSPPYFVASPLNSRSLHNNCHAKEYPLISVYPAQLT